MRFVIIYFRLFYMIFLERIFSLFFGERVRVSVKRSRRGFVSESSDDRRVLVKENTCVRARSVLGNSSVFSETLCFCFKNYLYLAVRLG